MSPVRPGLLVVLSLVAACAESATVTCPAGIVCPQGQVCSPLGGCVLPQQLDACDPPPADGFCALPGGEQGGCIDGVCLKIGCGNGVVEPGERCDDGNRDNGDGCSAACDSDERCGNGVRDDSLSEACDCGDAALPDDLRPPACEGQPNSDDVGSKCTADCQILGCGDGVVQGFEQCDGTALSLTNCSDYGFYAGTLGCHETCLFDVSGCSGYCGDQVLDAGEEDCDTQALGGADCTTFTYYRPGTLGCNAVCGFDLTGCATAGYCGDGAFDAGFEACDPGESSADLAARGLDCTDYGFYNADGLACGTNCQVDLSGCSGKCGDGVLQAADEDCDGDTNLGGKTCASFGYYNPTGLACLDNCSYDFSGCSERCGDGVVNGAELCDGSVPAGMDCTDVGFYAPGTLACNSACSLDTSGCSGTCGDGAITGPEQCEPSLPLGRDCTAYGYYVAAGLACTGCTFDTSMCTGGRCGDGTVQPAEDCEPGVGFAQTCSDPFGFYEPGGLACSQACNFDLASCRGECGDGAVNGPEICDGAPPPVFECALAGWDAGQLGCANGCDESFEHCRFVGFRDESPGDGAPAMVDAWGVGDEWFAVADSDIRHSRGGAWSKELTTATGRQGIWGVQLPGGTVNVWAVGDPQSTSWGIHQYDGSTWSLATVSVPSPTRLTDVWASGPTDVWAVGLDGTVLRSNGTWSKATTPIPGTATLTGVWGDGSTVFVVGESGLIYRWNGSWTNQSITVSPPSFTAVGGRSATDVYAVGGNSIYAYNGTAWAPAGTCGSATHVLQAVAASPGGPVMVAGFDANDNVGIICQRVGTSWIRIDDGLHAELRSVASSARDFVVTGAGSIQRSNGATWIPFGKLPAAISYAALWGTSSSNLFAVGTSLTSAQHVAWWNGTTWQTQSISGATTSALREVWGGSGWAVAVGDGGQIIASNGSGGATWGPQTSGTTQRLNAVWGDNTTVYVAGDAGTVLTRPATGSTTWTAVTGIPTTASYGGVWGASGGPVFVVGTGGVILRRQAGTWSTMTSNTTRDLSAVWGRSATEVYAAGNNVFLRFDGSTWTQIAQGDLAVRDLGGSTTDLFALSISSRLVRQYVGDRLLQLRTSPSATYVDVLGLSDVTFFLDGSRGQVTALAGRLFAPTAETECDDVWDDDGDGKTDCADPECAASPACANGGGCQPIVDVSCGALYSGTTVDGATRWPYYGAGCSTRDESGPEAYVRVKRATAGPIQLALSSASDLDLIVSSSSAAACTPDERCLAAAQNAGGTESTSITATANTEYIVSIDGFAGASGAFTLQVTCP